MISPAPTNGRDILDLLNRVDAALERAEVYLAWFFCAYRCDLSGAAQPQTGEAC